MFNLQKKIQKIRFVLIWDGFKRANYLKKKNILRGIGEGCLFQSRNFPMDPKLLLLHNNVIIAANVTFVTHDAIRHLLEKKYNKKYAINLGPIEVEDNVFIGAGTIVLPNVRIGRDSIIAAGSVVTKDVLPGSVIGGCPAKKIGDFEEINKKRESKENLANKTYNEMVKIAWEEFYYTRN